MILYATLKANNDAEIDLEEYYWYNIGNTGCLFCEKEHCNSCDETDYDELYKKYSQKQINQRIWKRIKEEFAKKTQGHMVRYNNLVFADLDCSDIVYKDVESLIEDGTFKKSDVINVAHSIEKKGFDIIYEEEYTNQDGNIRYRYLDLYDLANKYFPCQFDDDGCKGCGNCD